MSTLSISLIALACIFGGTLLGMILRSLLPKDHLNDDTRDAIKLGIGMIATMAALVLSLMISSAKGAFDTLNNGLRNTGTKIILLDRAMARYGPETKEARDILKGSVSTAIERLWPAGEKTIEVKKFGGQSTNKLKISRRNCGNCPRETATRPGFRHWPSRSKVKFGKGYCKCTSRSGKARSRRRSSCC